MSLYRVALLVGQRHVGRRRGADLVGVGLEGDAEGADLGWGEKE